MTIKRGPLDGLKVVDLSTVFAVPYVGALLGDMGAEVLKIEAPDRLEQTRGVVFGPLLNNELYENPWDYAGVFQVLNRNKRSVSLNLRTEEAREVLWKLLAEADILLDNFTPRVLRGWGMSPETIAERNPHLIHMSNTGFGSSGPWKNFKAQGTTLEYTMGVGAYSGYGPGAPQKVGQSYPDFLAAWTQMSAIMAALIERRSTGKGQWIDVGMYQLGPSVIPEAAIAAQVSEDLEVVGSIDRHAAVSGVFESAESERWVALSANEEQWQQLQQLVPELTADTPQNALVSWVGGHSPGQITTVLDQLEIPGAEVLDSRDLLQDEQIRSRAFYEFSATADDEDERPLIGRPYTWTGPTDVKIRCRAPRFGEHNDEVLAEAGVSATEVARLRETQIVADAPIGAPAINPQDMDVQTKHGSYRYLDAEYRDVLAAYRAAL